MLPAAHRLTRSSGFQAATRRGRRARRGALVVHLARSDGDAAGSPVRIGLVVSRAVGPAVVRTRVKRRLRHVARDRLSSLPPGAVVVLRALPQAGRASSAELAQDLDACLGSVLSGGRPVA